MDKLKRVTDGTFYMTLQKYLEARIEELDAQWTGDTSIDLLRQLQGRKLEVQDILKQLTREPIKLQHLDGYGD
jgi:hypothetical protein